MLDLIADCPSETIGSQSSSEHILFIQPGMRYVQAQVLVKALMEDEYFSALTPLERKTVTDKILEDVRGRMLEDIVLLETARTLPREKRAFKLMFAAGEIDMIVYDAEQLTCRLYEVKHSDQKDHLQYRHLIDEEKCRAIEHKYGEIISRTVLYRGEHDTVKDGEFTIEYENIEEYLKGL